MLIRDFYATALKQGIYGANAYDIPRIERVSVDTRYWMNSGLPGAPTGLAADQLNSHTRQTTVGLIGGRQDWGYWYDIEIANAKTGIFLFAGNDAVGKLVTRNVQYGIYTTNVNAPGLQITHSDISASVEGVHYEVDGLQTLVATATTFRDAPIGIHTLSKTSHGVSLTDCTFRNWDRYALYMEGGHLTTDDNRFEDDKPAIKLEATVSQALLSGNTFAAPETALTAADTTLVQRDDTAKVAPCVPDYTFTPAETRSAATDRLFLVTDYGAQAGGVRDCTAAFQEALTAAGEAGGGTVYIPGGTYRLNGSLTVPSGVELRGSFDGAHYGNSTFNGTHLYVYGGKNDQTAAPLITLAKNAGAKGFTVFYPEQGFTDQTEGVEEAEQIKTYPYTLRADAGCWLENLAIVGAYDGIDAITNRCDGLVVRDVTGCVLHDTIQVGHGMRGGTLHNLHLNPSGWSQQGNYENSPTGKLPDGVTKRSDLFDDYETREATYLTLGDCRDLQIFSCFNIVIATQLRLIADPYTGGSFEGVTWGVAFDASRDGVVGKIGDVFAGVGVTESIRTSGNDDGMRVCLELLEKDFTGLSFINFVDFDTLYGHRRDAKGYAEAVMRLDAWLPRFIAGMKPDDILMITADHGCDPNFAGSDHTRENVPLLVYGRKIKPVDLGTLSTYSDIAATIAAYFGVPYSLNGKSFLNRIL